MPKPGAIKMPYAIADDGQLIHVRKFRKGTDSGACISCGQTLVARQGKQKQWHFAHRGTDCPGGEGALHRATKLLIKQSFERARAESRPYEIRWSCPACKTPRCADGTKLATVVQLEAAPADGIRADLYFSHGNKDFAVEVAVTHDIEQPTQERYQTANIPVFVTRPSWDTLESYEGTIEATEALNLDYRRCQGCHEKEQRRKKKEQEKRRREGIRAQFRAYLEKLPPSDSTSPERWQTDKRGNPLYPRIQSRLHAYARKLLKLGFQQAQTKPWLFLLKLGKKGVVFANMGGTEEVPIWEDPTPMLHWQLKVPEWEKKAIVREIMEYCERRYLPTRLSFYNGHYYPGNEDYDDDDHDALSPGQED